METENKSLKKQRTTVWWRWRYQ